MVMLVVVKWVAGGEWMVGKSKHSTNQNTLNQSKLIVLTHHITVFKLI